MYVRLRLVLNVVLLILPLGLGAQSIAPVRLRAGDLVRLEVRDEPTLAGEYRVDEAGRVLFPLIGLVPVAGRDFEGVRRDVEAAYAGELHEREVRLTPLMRVTVSGEARQPGLFSVDPTMSLADVLARAGGFGPEANRGRIELVRDGVVVAAVAQRDVPAFGQPLRSGDVVVIGRLSWIQRNSPALIGTGASVVVALVTALVLR